MAKEQLKELVRTWQIAFGAYHTYMDNFFTKTMNGEVVKRATKVLDKKELETIHQLESRERSLRSAWEKALL